MSPPAVATIDAAPPKALHPASRVLAEAGVPAIAPLREAVRTGNDQVVGLAATALGHHYRAAKEALPDLFQIAGSDEHSDAARIAAISAALKIDADKSRESSAISSIIPLLIRTLENGSFTAQANAVHVLAEIGPAAKDALPILRKRLALPAKKLDTGQFVSVHLESQWAIDAIEDDSIED